MSPVRIILLLQTRKDASQTHSKEISPIHVQGILGHPKEDEDGDGRDDGDVPIDQRHDGHPVRRYQENRVPGQAINSAGLEGGKVVLGERGEVRDVVHEPEKLDGEVGDQDAHGHEVEAAFGAARATAGCAVGGCEGGGCCCCDFFVADVCEDFSGKRKKNHDTAELATLQLLLLLLVLFLLPGSSQIGYSLP